MRRRNREISIFGMSALDLFASALGAFILISVVIFPYFPNTSPTPVDPVVCPVCPPPAEPEEPTPCPDPVVCPVCPVVTPVTCPEPTQDLARTQFPHFDLVIALDITSSMGQQIEDLKSEVGQLSEVLSRLSPTLGIGLVAFGDRFFEEPLTTFDLREISGSPGNLAAFRDFVNELEIGVGRGGGVNSDVPEAFLMALNQAVGMSWRPQAEERAIVLITDSPGYPEDVTQTFALANNLSGSGGYRISTVYVETGVGGGTVESFLERVANVGGGQFVRDTGGSLTVNLLLSLL